MATYKVYFADAGVAATGLTLAWSSLKKVSDGTDEASQPAFTEIGGGWYKYSYSPTEDMIGVIDGSATLTTDTDRYVPVDFTTSDITLADWINGGRLDLILDAINLLLNGGSHDLATIHAAVGAVDTDTGNLLARLTADRAGYLDNLDGHVAQTGDNYARLGAPTGASVSADVLNTYNKANANGGKLDTIDGIVDTINANTVEVDIGSVKGVAVASVDDFKADVSGLSTFDPASDAVDTGFSHNAAMKRMLARLDGDDTNVAGVHTFKNKAGDPETIHDLSVTNVRTQSEPS